MRQSVFRWFVDETLNEIITWNATQIKSLRFNYNNRFSFSLASFGPVLYCLFSLFLSACPKSHNERLCRKSVLQILCQCFHSFLHLFLRIWCCISMRAVLPAFESLFDHFTCLPWSQPKSCQFRHCLLLWFGQSKFRCAHNCLGLLLSRWVWCHERLCRKIWLCF